MPSRYALYSFFFVSAYSIPFEMTLAMFNSRLLHLLPLLATALAAPQNVPQALANLDRQMKDAGKLYFGAGVDRSIIEESETADILNEVFGAVTPMNKQVHTFLNAKCYFANVCEQWKVEVYGRFSGRLHVRRPRLRRGVGRRTWASCSWSQSYLGPGFA